MSNTRQDAQQPVSEFDALNQAMNCMLHTPPTDSRKTMKKFLRLLSTYDPKVHSHNLAKMCDKHHTAIGAAIQALAGKGFVEHLSNDVKAWTLLAGYMELDIEIADALKEGLYMSPECHEAVRAEWQKRHAECYPIDDERDHDSDGNDIPADELECNAGTGYSSHIPFPPVPRFASMISDKKRKRQAAEENMEPTRV